MIVYLIIATLGAMIFIALMRRFLRKNSEAAGRFRFLLITVILIGLLLLALTGRLHWLIALVGGILMALWRLVALIKFFPLLRVLPQLYRFWQYRRGQRQNAETGQDEQHQSPLPNNVMSKADALKILGLQGEPDQEVVLTAHKQLMQKLHPDKGGSNYLAALINLAKEKLLS